MLNRTLKYNTLHFSHFIYIPLEVAGVYHGAHDRNRTGEPLPYQGSALPTELRGLNFSFSMKRKIPETAISLWSGRRDSNSRHPAWKAEALPTELLPPLSASNTPRNFPQQPI